ncbi:phospho-sugar mutase [Aeromicrobium ginsengisoli]|uniref:Phospho-sugar mutase n=1 Tax=Aeromicrobium ginsengisoli TaxID=363867 RepID=A0A5M4FE16_9ACTN|nr:phospho-sugar mutase [Aeromicrobium ginsengisoli]KAA1397514.1 phospho-sugar mutase [Aeromicrobium ginsengisoli]
MTDELLARAREWLSQDPDPRTVEELQGLIDSGDTAGLEDRFKERLQFGTAGLRGALGAGPNRMNRVIVAQAAAGLAAYLLEHGSKPSVVVGYDARHNSDVFARDTAEIMEGAGVHAHLLPTHLPTPVLAFAIRHLGCSAGVMVTASHNPPQDNGYKVYLEDSSQIVPPADAEISAAIDAVGRVDEMPRSEAYELLGPEVAEAYVEAVIALPSDGPRDIVAVYTPMHGVGRDTLVEAVSRAGFPALHVVRDQAEPDPDFPTVAFPNPEEPGAMDLALKLSSEVGADIIVANDPDADRCAVGVRDGESYRMLTGDQVGVLLGDFLLRKGVQGTYAASIVSSDLLGRQAAAHGQPWEQTLTGFKWLGKIPTLVFGYEEALGYSVAPDIARDKDGVSAIITVLEMAAALKADGRTLIDQLDDIYREHGLHATSQLSVRVDDLSIIARAMQTLRTSPPSSLGGLAVTSVDDLANGYHGLPPTDGIRLGLEGNTRIIARPSGTEPKLKCYIEVVVPVDESIEASREIADEKIAAIKHDLSEALGL